jgi:hypothetical protein
MVGKFYLAGYVVGCVEGGLVNEEDNLNLEVQQMGIEPPCQCPLDCHFPSQSRYRYHLSTMPFFAAALEVTHTDRSQKTPFIHD